MRKVGVVILTTIIIMIMILVYIILDNNVKYAINYSKANLWVENIDLVHADIGYSEEGEDDYSGPALSFSLYSDYNLQTLDSGILYFKCHNNEDDSYTLLEFDTRTFPDYKDVRVTYKDSVGINNKTNNIIEINNDYIKENFDKIDYCGFIGIVKK